MRLYLADLQYMSPELTILIAAVILTLLDLTLPKRVSRNVLGWLTIVSLAISALFVVRFMFKMNSASVSEVMQPVQLLGDSYRIDDFANLFKLLFLLGTAFVIFMSIGNLKRERVEQTGEYYYLFLPAVLGAMIMASSGDLITLFVGLEILSITSYILVALRRASNRSSEAAFKYLVSGGIASALILYGMSFLYGVTGSTNIGEINEMLAFFDPSFTGLVYISFILMLAGFGFKISAAPFHAWAPDVYQGAPTPVTAFLAVVSKAAGLAITFRVLFNVYYNIGTLDSRLSSDLFFTITILASVAMILGNAMALKQRNVKRLLAYSGVANAGYLLVPLGIAFMYLNYSGFPQLYFYLIAYLFMNIGAFAVLMVVSRSAGHEEMSGFEGLYHRAPSTAIAMVIFILSLAGLPISAGFIGKVYIILGAVNLQVYWLALVMIATSVMSYYYYFGFIRQMFMRPGLEAEEIKVSKPLGITIWLCAGVTVLLGLFPNIAFSFIENAFNATVDLWIR